MTYHPHHLGQFLTPGAFTPASTLASKPAAPAPTYGTLKTGVMPIAPGISSSATVKLVTSSDRSAAAAKVATQVANKIRSAMLRLPQGRDRQPLASAEVRVRSLALRLPTKNLKLIDAFAQVNEAMREVAGSSLDKVSGGAQAKARLLTALRALRSTIAPPARSAVRVLPPIGKPAARLTPSQAVTVQAAVDAAVAKAAEIGTPVTEVSVKQIASDIIKETATDDGQATTMISSLKESPLVVSGGAKTDETKPVETLTSTPLTTESVAAIVSATESAPPAPEPDKKDEAASTQTTEAIVTLDALAPPSSIAPPAAAEPASLVAPATVEAEKKEGLFGVPWMYVGIGAGALVVGGLIMSRRSPAPTPNKRRRRKRSSRRSS